MFYRYRASIPWRELPECFGDWKNVHRPHSRWSKAGVRETILKYLASNADYDYVMINSTMVRAHQHGASPQKPAKTMSLDAPEEG